MNPFEALAERQIPNPVKSRMKGVETRRVRALEKKQAEGDILFKLWQRWHQKRRDELLAGPYGAAATELATFLEGMLITTDTTELIELVKRGCWDKTDADTRFQVLSMVDRKIIYLRERNSLPPFDDALPFSDESLTVFQIVKGLLS